MAKSHTILAGAFLVLSGAVAHPAAADTPEKCTPENTLSAEALDVVSISTGADGIMTHPNLKMVSCVRVKQDKTLMVTWKGDVGVEHLVIQFRPAKKGELVPPDDPACWGAECTLNKDKMLNKVGEYEYRILVIATGGRVKVIDPRMIIVP